MSEHALGLFEGIGLELEYMIVDTDELDVDPVSDVLLERVSGNFEGTASRGPITWSNELVLHVLELKTSTPVASLQGVAADFHRNVQEINRILNPDHARLMPTAMHPWMDPDVDTRLWPHESGEVYQAFDKIFDCRGHGWANLQSMHINLPWSNDEEFGRLHAALRLLLPILPSLAASSPILEGRAAPFRDERLAFYRRNSAQIPSVSGAVIPEPIFTPEQYKTQILDRIYRDLAPYDPQGILQQEWTNARGIIARFVRNTFEIRIIDVQECPLADVAIAALVVAVTKRLVNETWGDYQMQRQWSVAALEPLFLECALLGSNATITRRPYLEALGISRPELPVTDLWLHLLEITRHDLGEYAAVAEKIIRRGCLAQRILDAIGSDFTPRQLKRVYARLCDCLEANEVFLPESLGEARALPAASTGSALREQH